MSCSSCQFASLCVLLVYSFFISPKLYRIICATLQLCSYLHMYLLYSWMMQYNSRCTIEKKNSFKVIYTKLYGSLPSLSLRWVKYFSLFGFVADKSLSNLMRDKTVLMISVILFQDVCDKIKLISWFGWKCSQRKGICKQACTNIMAWKGSTMQESRPDGREPKGTYTWSDWEKREMRSVMKQMTWPEWTNSQTLKDTEYN